MQSPGLLIPISSSHTTSKKPSSSSPTRQSYFHTPPKHSKELPFIYSPIHPSQGEFLNRSLYDDSPSSRPLHSEVAAHNNIRGLHHPKDSRYQTNWNSPDIGTKSRNYSLLDDPDYSKQRVNTLDTYDRSRPYLNKSLNTNRFIKVLGEDKTSGKQPVEMSYDQSQQRRYDLFSHDTYGVIRNEYSGSRKEQERARTPIRRINRKIDFPNMHLSEEHRIKKTFREEEMGRMSALGTKRDAERRLKGYMVSSMKMKASRMFERLLKKEEMLSEYSSGRDEVISDLERSLDAGKTASKQIFYGNYARNDDGYTELSGCRGKFPHVEGYNDKTHRSICANGRRYVESNNDYKIRRVFDGVDTELKDKLEWIPSIPRKKANDIRIRKSELRKNKHEVYKGSVSQQQSPQKNTYYAVPKVRKESSNIPLESKGMKHNRTYTLIESTI